MLLFFLCLASTTRAGSCNRSSRIDLLHAPLIWVNCCGVIPSLEWPYDGPYAIQHHVPRSFTIRVGARNGINSVSRFKPCTDADTKPGNLRHCGRQTARQWPSWPPPAAAVLPHSGGSHFQTPYPGLYTFTSGQMDGIHFFPIPQGGFWMLGPAAPSIASTAVVPQRQQRLPVRINL